MALVKEIWVKQLLENFYPQGNFLTKVTDFSELVENNKIHIPSAGIDPKVLINNTTYPISIKERDDFDHEIPLATFSTENTLVRRPEAIEYSYDKLESVISQHRNTLSSAVAMKAAHAYAPQNDSVFTPVIETSGTTLNDRLSLCFNDVLNLKERFDEANIPLEDRYLVLHPKHVTDLLREDIQLFKELTNITAGEPTKFAGFGIFAFSKCLITRKWAGTSKIALTAKKAVVCVFCFPSKGGYESGW